MAVSDKKRQSLDRYNATCDYISLRPKKPIGAAIRAAAKAAGQSVQGYVLQACAQRMAGEGMPLVLPDADQTPPERD